MEGGFSDLAFLSERLAVHERVLDLGHHVVRVGGP